MVTLDGPWLNDEEGRADIQRTRHLGENRSANGRLSRVANHRSGPTPAVAIDRSARTATIAGDRGNASLRRTLVAVDVTTAALAGVVVVIASAEGIGSVHLIARLAVAALLVGGAVAANATQGLYRARVCAVKAQERVGITRTALVTGIGARLVANALHASVSVAVAAIAGLVLLLAMTGGRAMFAAWLRVCRSAGRFTRDVVLIGVNEEAVDLVSLIEGRPELGYRVRGLIGDRDEADRIGCADVPVLGNLEEATEAFARSGASGAIVLTSAVDPTRSNEIVRSLLDAGVHVQLGSGLSRFGHRRLRAQPLSHETLFYVERVSFSPAKLLTKRILDVVLSGALIVISAPVMVAACIAIKLGDRGPVLFRQERTGQGGSLFTLYKLRTMVPDASARLNDLIGSNERQGPLFKLTTDPRVTRVGRVLRATSIDELPQLFNVFLGRMSLVGPRPALDHEVANFDDELTAAKMAVPPGITGLWQVEARDNPSFGAYRNLDLFYIENWSVSLDLAILTATVPVVIGRGLRPLAVRLRRSRPQMTPCEPARQSERAANGHQMSGGLSREPVLDLRDQTSAAVSHASAAMSHAVAAVGHAVGKGNAESAGANHENLSVAGGSAA